MPGFFDDIDAVKSIENIAISSRDLGKLESDSTIVDTPGGRKVLADALSYMQNAPALPVVNDARVPYLVCGYGIGNNVVVGNDRGYQFSEEWIEHAGLVDVSSSGAL